MPREPNAVDAHIGKRVRARREELQMTQEDLHKRTGWDIKVIDDYENGTDCISAAQLKTLHEVLDVRVGYFFEGLA